MRFHAGTKEHHRNNRHAFVLFSSIVDKTSILFWRQPVYNITIHAKQAGGHSVANMAAPYKCEEMMFRIDLFTVWQSEGS